MRWLCLFAVMLLFACSQRQVYDSIQTGQRNECELLSGVQREECLQRLSPDYQTYERQRQELLKENDKLTEADNVKEVDKLKEIDKNNKK